MKILLVGMNAKYIHSNLAIRSLQKYAFLTGHRISICEYTINQSVDYILSDIYKQQPDILCFSCYLWNIEMIKKLIVAYEKIMPSVDIFLGGPEVSYHGEKLIEEVPFIKGIICGEGEETFRQLVDHLENGFDQFDEIKGLVYQREGRVIHNPARLPLSMDVLPFVYENGLQELENRILYYETIRGCPYQCQYCLSSIEQGVRFRSIDLVKKELDFFLRNKVVQVKFVDRTFNCKKSHCMEIWKYLHENDNGVTNFHFEISGDLLDEEMLDFFETIRPGLFQFEIGVQSTNEPTLDAIKRRTDFERLIQNVKRLRKSGRIHLHLDLIAGLPFEGYSSFRQSFHDVYQLRPDQLQLGFLKVLKGSGLHRDAEKYGILYRDYAPYEVLCTKDISYSELERLKMIEEMVEIYYNSGLYENTLVYLGGFFRDSFKLYEGLAGYWEEKDYHRVSHSRIGIATILKEFANGIEGCKEDFLVDVIKFDFCLKEKVKRFPEWMESSEMKLKDFAKDFYRDEKNIAVYLPQLVAYSSKQISRMVAIEEFRYDLGKFQRTSGKEIDKLPSRILFNYYDMDQMRQNARIHSLEKK